MLCAVAQGVGQVFTVADYSATSNAGEIALLIGATVLVYLVQEDLALAGSFADYLRTSNIAFKQIAEHEEGKTRSSPRSSLGKGQQLAVVEEGDVELSKSNSILCVQL